MAAFPQPAAPSLLSRLWAQEQASSGLRVGTALAVMVAVCWQQNRLALVPTLLLGILAAALAETDDNWLGRLKAVALMLACFATAAAGTLWLFPHPLPFALALAVSTFALTLLGALGERYATIANATVTLALYTMIGADQHDHGGGLRDWHGAALLLAGATWYGLLSVLWAAVFANRPVRERLAVLFVELGRFLRLKADLFEPLRQVDEQAQRLALARQNARVVAALNAAMDAILSRFGRSGRPGVQSGLYFRLYYLAQDFHERASSSHYPYQALAQAFFHSDVLYRCGRLLAQQGKACMVLGQAISLRQPFVYGQETAQAMTDLDESLQFLRARGDPGQQRLLGSLELLARNLHSIERQLCEAVDPDATLDGIDTRLRDQQPHTLGEMASRIGQQLTPRSVLFRHGLRLATAMVASYAVMPALHSANGFWIMVTASVVCRPTFGATRLRLVERIAGTLVGLGLTWALMQLFPSRELQLLIALAATLVFFVTRNGRYVAAAGAITVMALLCINLIGDGFVLLLPRLVDTLVGCAIAAAVSFLVLPDWQGRNLHRVAAAVLEACAHYLDLALAFHREGGGDDLAYRVARRDMHNADAALSAALANMARDPPRQRRNLDAGFRFLALSNTVLGYLSALGAHRGERADDATAAAIAEAGDCLRRTLEDLAQALAGHQPLPAGNPPAEIALAERLEAAAGQADKPPLMNTQLALLLRLLPRLREAAAAVTAGT
ncbi:MAG: YccS family putative transporter [Pseudoxanthomonas sp.]